MFITKIKRIGSTNRFHVYVDDKWTGIFLDETLAREQLKTGMEIDDDRFKEIKEENDHKVAFDMAVSYLERYVVSEKGIKDYLKKKGFSVQVIGTIIDKLRDYGFVDDEKFARNYFESLSSGKGKRVIAQKLKEKGVSAEIVNQLLEGVEEEDEIEKATVIANKFVKNRQKDANLKKKCLAHLIYKGYDYSVAQKVVATVCKGEENDWL